jgi:methionine aminopeptidase
MIDEDNWTVRSADGSDVAHTERCLVITKDGYELLS